VSGICVKQGLQSTFEHTWRWNTKIPMWQSLEMFDPWVNFPLGAKVQDVTFERKFTDQPEQLTVVIVPGNTHNPLNHDRERSSLNAWLDKQVPKALGFYQNGFDYERFLPELQQRLGDRANQPAQRDIKYVNPFLGTWGFAVSFFAKPLSWAPH